MNRIYLDHAATTPMRPEVRDAMRPYLEEAANPSSTHATGRAARAILEEARERVASALGARREQVVFTSGGTEADNLGVLGVWRAASRRADASPPVAVSAVEHSAVLGAAHQAVREGATLLVLGVDEHGTVCVDGVEEILAARPAVLAVMWANNEVGTVQPVGLLAERCAAAGVPLHVDAVQAVGRLRVRVDEVDCDFLALSGHKLGGPQGTGALFIRGRAELEPLTHGGGQERGLRPGTHNLAGIVGLSLAVALAVEEQEAESLRLERLRDRLAAGLRARVPGVVMTAEAAERLPQTLHIRIPGAETDTTLVALDLGGVEASGGSACHSGAVEPSHVLVAMGLGAPPSGGAPEAVLRFSLGRTTTEEHIDGAIGIAGEVLGRVGLAAVR